MIDWSKLKPREILEIAQSIPRIAERWEYKPGSVETWKRLLWTSEYGYRLPPAVLTAYQGGWRGHVAGKLASGTTGAEARFFADRNLREAGYVLDDDLACNVEDGVTSWCRGCGRRKDEHQTYPKDPKRPSIDDAPLTERERFYESVMTGPPHQLGGRRCKIAVKLDIGCCNPKCNGMWGSGCWCCHYMDFAVDADPESIRQHLALRAKLDERAMREDRK